MEPKLTKLNLGCGPEPLPGWLNMDHDSYGRDDILVHEFDKFPWPLPANTFEEVRAWMILEHVGDLISTMAELHRVLKSGGRLDIQVPYWTGPNVPDDPTHKRGFSTRTFQWWTGEFDNWYINESWKAGGGIPFRIVAQTIKISAALPFLDLIPKIVGGRAYDRVFAHLLPAQGLHVILEKR